ncbi:GNAT family N-acetyltransferase [Chamaesiphon polymorphus]|uniref:GNAT family N-acetyltransferase n=1 Tax=Chamaesiphon polymorphus CCALA 037 TaxID=2107692 RepID=A0A2T1GIS4_9CYAN|nr:GNAT family N-acetyltransferase [Chamaesiphon polymorphus]PSB57652.1 GNAT family N-acetyltransferase [Chamaesiphon polymorphus CCALA 037]
MTVTAPKNLLQIRTGTAADAQACSQICYEAFTQISERHGFVPDFSHPEMTEQMMAMLFAHPKIYSVVAEADGQIVGSNFLWEESAIAGVGPITVAPHFQNANLGKRLMATILDRAQQQGFAGVRLVQAAFHNRSLSLYTKLGFDVQEPLAHLQGTPLAIAIPGYAVRLATEADLAECNRLCQQVHGFARSQECDLAIQRGTATVVERDGRITGYATTGGFFGHAVGERNEDLKALIAAATLEGSGFLLPTRNSDLFRWCLEQGFRVVQPMTLMSLGIYKQPQGAFLPSILF